jgi:MscS family membrane protein
MKFLPKLAARIFVVALGILLCASRVAGQTNGSVAIIAPGDGQRFDPRANITLEAKAEVVGLKGLEFISDGRVIGSVSNEPFSLVWSNVPAGTYNVIARALPESGSAVDSPPVQLRVYYALLTFGLDRIAVLNRCKIFEIPLWQYLASLIYIFLAFYVSKLLDFLTRVWLKKWAEKTETKFDDLLLDVLNGPIKIIAFVIFLRIGLEVFSWPALVQIILSKGFTIVVAWTLTYMALKFIDLVMGYWRQRAKPDTDRTFDEQLFPIIRKSLKVFIVVVGILVTLDNIGVNITAAIASLSIGGLAIGLAAQDTLANLFGAVAVFMDKPFRIGDRIQLDSVDGTVESIGMRSTRVRNLDGYLITIPNKTMGNSTITNITRRANIKTEINLGLTYDTSVEKLKRAVQILEEIYRAHPQTHDLLISFNKFTDSTLNIQVVHWWKGTDGKACLAGMQEMNFKVKERFEAEQLDFAFPSKTVYLKQDSQPAAAQLNQSAPQKT